MAGLGREAILRHMAAYDLAHYRKQGVKSRLFFDLNCFFCANCYSRLVGRILMTISGVPPGYKVPPSDGGHGKFRQRHRGHQDTSGEHEAEKVASFKAGSSVAGPENADGDNDTIIGGMIDVTV
jgi:hypothetical protein